MLFTTGGIPAAVLETAVEEWVRKMTGVEVVFNSLEAVRLLESLCLLRQSKDDDLLYVIPVDVALRSLPQQTQTLVKRFSEQDIAEGYEKDYGYEETEDSYKQSDKKKKRFGWW